MEKVKRERLTDVQARFFAQTLDRMEADLVTMQHQLFRMRKAMQAHIGETMGYQYDDDKHALVPKAAPEGRV